jgi:uncharacterized protein
MNPHEQAILENFLDQLVRVRGTRKIPEADAMIRRAVDRQPDAAYLLVQRSLMLGQALEQAKARLAEYELGQEQGGFLDAGASSAHAPMPQTMVAASAAERSRTIRPGPASALPGQLPTGGPPASPEPLRGGGTAGFLGQAAATAAGVAGGTFLFQGLENLFGSHGGSALGHEAQSFIPEDVTVNNYYGSDEGPNRADDDRPNRPDDFEATDDDDMLSDDDNNDDDDADLI